MRSHVNFCGLLLLSSSSVFAQCEALENDYNELQKVCNQLSNVSSEVANKAPGFLGLLGLVPGAPAFLACEAAKVANANLVACHQQEEKKKQIAEEKKRGKELAKDSIVNGCQAAFVAEDVARDRRIADCNRSGQQEMNGHIENLEGQGVDITHPEVLAELETVRAEIQARVDSRCRQIEIDRIERYKKINEAQAAALKALD